MASDDDLTPDWIYWLAVPSVTLSEAVALSVNVDPRKLFFHETFRKDEHGSPYREVYFQPPPPAFQPRLELAERCFGETLPAATPRDGERHVKLVDFANWAVACNVPVPAELRALASGGAKPTAVGSGGAKPTVVNEKLLSAVLALKSELGRPGRDIPWKIFSHRVLSHCGVSEKTRGFGERSIRRAIKEIEAIGPDGKSADEKP